MKALSRFEKIPFADKSPSRAKLGLKSSQTLHIKSMRKEVAFKNSNVHLCWVINFFIKETFEKVITTNINIIKAPTK
jgi:hypothetical protein